MGNRMIIMPEIKNAYNLAYNLSDAAELAKKEPHIKGYIKNSFLSEVHHLLSKEENFEPTEDNIATFAKKAASTAGIPWNSKKSNTNDLYTWFCISFI